MLVYYFPLKTKETNQNNKNSYHLSPISLNKIQACDVITDVHHVLQSLVKHQAKDVTSCTGFLVLGSLLAIEELKRLGTRLGCWLGLVSISYGGICIW